MLATPERYKIHYYLVTEDGLFRLSDRLHRDLLSGGTALVQFADTKQKLIELIFSGPDAFASKARGVIYAFDKNGFLDLRTMTQDATPAMPRFMKENAVTDLAPAIRKQRFQADFTWKPSQAMLSSLFDEDTKKLKKIPAFNAKQT